MVVSAEQSQAVESTYEVLHHCVSDRVAIKSRSASTELIQDGKGTAGCELKNILCLLHFNVKGTFTFKDPVTSSNPSKNAIDWCKLTDLRRHIASNLSQYSSQSSLSEEGRLAAHVGTGN